MAVPNGRGINAGHFYSNLVQPISIDVQFQVAHTDSGGYGIKSLKSNGYVQNVFMNTTATGAATTVGNPNPAAGFVWVHLNNNFNTYIGGKAQIQSPNSGSDLAITSGLTLGQAYVITVLGTSTLADWNAIGLPAGLTPTVGQSFVGIKTGNGSGSGKVKVPGVSGVTGIEIVGNPSTQSMNSSIAANGGAWILAQFLGATNSSTTTPIATAPADGSVVSLSLRFDQSSVTVDGL